MQSTSTHHEQSVGRTRVSPPAGEEPTPALRMIAFAVLILAFAGWCYAPAVVNGFHGDDFLHVSWLAQAAKNPSMVWDNFTGPWLGATEVKFYRPLISVIFWSEYQLWGFNAIGYHLTNIGFHLAGVICLLFIGRRLALLSGLDESASRTTGVLAAVLWALYPLNAEVVAWITGRVDATVTAFTLGAILYYLKWRDSRKVVTLAISLTLFVLALLCKEMAVIIPPLLVCIDVLFHDGSKFGRIRSLPFWLVLAGYFVVRQLAMGTVIGAYDNTLDTDWRLLWRRFKEGLPFVFFPFNLNIFQRSDLIVKIWKGLLVALLSLGLLQLIATRAKTWRLYALCSLWFAFALLPVYKVFSIAQNLESSRYAYSAVVPLCLLLAVMATPLLKIRLLSRFQYAIFILFSGIAAFALHTHSAVWGEAGQISTKIGNQIYQLIENRNGPSAVVLMGAPDNINGAYVMRNAIPGMLTQPYFSKPVEMALNLDRFCALYPFALFRDSRTTWKNAIVVCWNDDKKRLEHAQMAPSNWSVSKSELPLQNVHVGGGTAKRTEQGLTIVAPQKYTILDLRDLNADCASIDLIQVTLKNCTENLEPSTMTYVNGLHPNAWPTWSSTIRPSVIRVAPDVVRMIFPLRQHPEWALGKKCTELVFGIPASGYTITSIEATSAFGVVPQITLPKSAVQGCMLTLGKEPAEVIVKQRNKKAFVLEITPRGQYFEKQYASSPRLGSVLKSFSPNERILLDRTTVGPGLFQARIWQSGTRGQVEGLSSDHFTIFVPPEAK